MKSHHVLVVSCLALTGGLLAAPAHAQMGGTGGAAGAFQNPRLANAPKTAPGQGAAQPPPPAIPGVKTEPTPVAAAERPPSDMPPNDALFDAINRGDTPAARDALNRGADLEATNVLGMTPLALSVDLGRDDISFILLSMRGAEPRRGPPTQTAANVPPPKPGRAIRVSATPVADRPARPTTSPAPTQVANDPGTPHPDAGFLGFGPR